MSIKSTLLRGLGVVVVVGASAIAVLVWQRGLEPEAADGRATMRRMDAAQFRTAIHYAFGQDIRVDAALPLLPRKDGLVALGATISEMTPAALDQFDRVARDVASQVTDESHRSTLIPCVPEEVGQPDDGCATQFFARTGRYLLRRPLTEAELSGYVQVARDASARLGDFYRGLSAALAGMLVSPEFLYVVETTEEAPASDAWRLDDHSLATRLSFFLWNGPPDDALLDAADAGLLNDEDVLTDQLDRMLASPRLADGVRAFFADLLRLEDFESISKDSLIYPAFTYAASQAIHEQVLRLAVDHLVGRSGDSRDLFTTNRTFVNRALGPLYRVPVALSESSDEWVALELDPDRSAGVLTSMSFLAAHSHPGRSSPTLRGKAVREIFLCQRVPDPPPTVDFAVFEDLSGKLTARERLKAHDVAPTCRGCHKLTDPIGLAFEKYDGAGQFRTTENGVPIDPAGEFDGRSFDDVSDLGRAVSEHPALVPCFVRRLFAYAVGREVGRGDARFLAWLSDRFGAHGYRVPPLMREIVQSHAFRAVSGAPESVVTPELDVADIR